MFYQAKIGVNGSLGVKILHSSQMEMENVRDFWYGYGWDFDQTQKLI